LAVETGKLETEPMPLPPISDLRVSLRSLLRQVPAGRVTTFGRLALALGDVVAARWVADWLWNDPAAGDLPSHRVVLKDGTLGGSRLEVIARQTTALRSEGVAVSDGRVDLLRYGFEEFESDAPLAHLQKSQQELSTQISLSAPTTPPALVGGVDLSYLDDWHAVAAYVLVDGSTGTVLWSVMVPCEVRFPYITGYLSFREIPVHELSLAAAKEAGKLPDVLLVDGSGILHKRQAGIASHLGVVTGLRTIGVTKKLLCGDVNLKGLTAGESRPVMVDGQVRGWAHQVREKGQPVFISPGNGCDVTYSLDVAQRLLMGRKLPEPIWWADRLSREAVRQIRALK
jgi:deoxyribonuclease V